MRMNLKIGLTVIVLISLSFLGCQKSENRTCFKTSGDYAEREVAIDSVRFFEMNKGIKYRLIQDDQRKVVIKGGANMINNISVENRDNVLYVNNENKCTFLRSEEGDIVEVEVHYPHYRYLYFDATDSVVFEDKIKTYSLYIEMRNGGGSMYVNVEVTKLSIIVSAGAGDFTLLGSAKESELKIQNNGSGNALGFNTNYVYLYQNSTADFFISLLNTHCTIVVDGTGNVYYQYDPANILRQGLGSGEILPL